MRLYILLILFTYCSFFNCNSQTSQEDEEKTRTKINMIYDKNSSECSSGVDIVTDFNGKDEFWNICNLENGNRIIQIESHKANTFFQEIYFEKDGELIYALETEKYMPKNKFTQMIWSCEFYANNGKLISLISLGHGKTEDDEWNPEIIFDMYKNRISEIKKMER